MIELEFIKKDLNVKIQKVKEFTLRFIRKN